jgi:hypothetical protein
MGAQGRRASRERPCSTARVGVLYEWGTWGRQRGGVAMEEDPLPEWTLWLKEWDANRRLRSAHPYVGDLINVLAPYGADGLSRQSVLRALEKNRRTTGLRIPTKFEQAAQGAYNRYCIDSTVFLKRNAPDSDGLFYSPIGKGPVYGPSIWSALRRGLKGSLGSSKSRHRGMLHYIRNSTDLAHTPARAHVL